MRHLILTLLAAGGALAAENFETTVLPILKANCLPCHDEQTRTSVEKELEVAQETLATAIVNATEYVASKNLDVTPGTDGATSPSGR